MVERANAALKISEAKYRDLVERMNEGVCHSDEHRIIRYANRCFYEMFGYPPDEIIGRSEESFLDGEGVRVYRREQRRRRRGESTRYELRVRARSGEMVPVLVSAVPVMDEYGRSRGAYAVFTDIRERKRIEVLKDEILRDVSHELKAPAAKIKMGLDLVKKRRPAPLDDRPPTEDPARVRPRPRRTEPHRLPARRGRTHRALQLPRGQPGRGHRFGVERDGELCGLCAFVGHGRCAAHHHRGWRRWGSGVWGGDE